MIRKPLLALAALVLGATGISLAPTAAQAAHPGSGSGSGSGPLLRVTARCDGPGSKMMLGIHPSRAGGVVAVTHITHVRHPHWIGETVIGNDVVDAEDNIRNIHIRTAVHHVVTDWAHSSQSWPKPVVASYLAGGLHSASFGPICTQAAESTRRADIGLALDFVHERLIGMRVQPAPGVVEVTTIVRPHVRARVAVNIRTAAGFQHRVRFVRADRYGIVDVRFRTFEKVRGYTRALARVMTGHGRSQIIQLARVR